MAGVHQLLDYETTLSPEILERAKNELGEDEFLRYECVCALREWLKKQPHLRNAPTGCVDLQFYKFHPFLNPHLHCSRYRCNDLVEISEGM